MQDNEHVARDKRLHLGGDLQSPEALPPLVVADARRTTPEVEAILDLLGPIGQFILAQSQDRLIRDSLKMEANVDDVGDKTPDDAASVDVRLEQLRRAGAQRTVVSQEQVREPEPTWQLLDVVVGVRSEERRVGRDRKS